MINIQLKNNYKIIDDNNIIIYLDRENEEPLELYVDREGFNKLKDFPYKWIGFYNKLAHDWYGKTTIYESDNGKTGKGKSMYLHRFLCDVTDPNIIVDHKDHHGLNDRMNNLRITDKGNNDKHRKGANSNNKSGYRNVFWNKKYDKWQVTICKNYKHHFIGYFNDLDKAIIAAEDARNTYLGDYAGKG